MSVFVSFPYFCIRSCALLLFLKNCKKFLKFTFFICMTRRIDIEFHSSIKVVFVCLLSLFVSALKGGEGDVDSATRKLLKL